MTRREGGAIGGRARTPAKLTALTKLRAVRAALVRERREQKPIPAGYRSISHCLAAVEEACHWPDSSRKELADYLGCHRKNVWRWLVKKSKSPRVETLKRMAAWRAKKISQARKKK